MADASVYSSGASFQGGALKVTDQGKVENLNASKLEGRGANDFIKTTNFGLSQSTGGVIGATGVTVSSVGVTKNYDTTSTIKIGNVIIKSSDNGNGILVGIE